MHVNYFKHKLLLRCNFSSFQQMKNGLLIQLFARYVSFKGLHKKDELVSKKYSSEWNSEHAVVFYDNDLEVRLDGSSQKYPTFTICYSRIDTVEYLDSYTVGYYGVNIEKVIKITMIDPEEYTTKKRRTLRLHQCIYFGPMSKEDLVKIMEIVFQLT